MRRWRLITVLTAALFVVPEAVSAGAWLREAGGYYLKVSAAYLFTREEIDSRGERTPIRGSELGLGNGTFEDIAVTAYLEYGLREDLTVTASLPYKRLTSTWSEFNDDISARREIEAHNNGFTDLRAGLRYPLKRRGFPISIEGSVKLPLGYDPTPDLPQVPKLGSGKVDADVSLLAGASLWPLPGYVGARAGYRARTGLADQLLFNLEGGGNWRALFVKVAIDGLYSTADQTDLGQSATTAVNSEDALKLVLELNYTIATRLSISTEAFHVLDGANTVAGTTWSAGIVAVR